MSEQQTQAPQPTLADIQQQYTALCNKAGHINYQLRTFQKDLEMIYDALRNLNLQAAALQAKEQQKAAEAALAAAQPAAASAPETPKEEVKTNGSN